MPLRIIGRLEDGFAYNTRCATRYGDEPVAKYDRETVEKIPLGALGIYTLVDKLKEVPRRDQGSASI